MLGRLMVQTAERFPEKTALTYQDRVWNWRQLLASVDRLVAELARSGVKHGDEVALWMRNSPTFVLAYFAVLLRGAVVVLCNPAWRVGDCPVRLAAVKVFLGTEDDMTACRAATGGLEHREPPQYLVCSESGVGSVGPSASAPAERRMEARGEQPALLQFSSGTTGRPKALIRTHAQCMAEVRHFRRTCGLTDRDVILGVLPLFHAHGMANTLWAAVGSGAHLVLMESPQPFSLRWQAAVELVAEHRVTVFPGVPLVFQTIARGLRNPRPLPTVRLCFSAGQSLTGEIFEEFLEKCGLAVRQLYGCTEAGSVTINVDADPRSSWNSVGRPMAGVLVEIHDDEGRSQTAGETGHVVFLSPSTGTYEEATMAKHHAPPTWFKPGDLGYRDNEGRLHIVGRKAFLISVAGEKVNVGEVEHVLEQHAHVAEAAVIGVPVERMEHRLVAFVAGPPAISAQEVLRFCRRCLPHYKCPQKIHVMAALPRTSLTKIDREALRRLAR